MITFVIVKTFIDGTTEQSPALQAPTMDFLLAWVDNAQQAIVAHCDVDYKIIEGVN